MYSNTIDIKKLLNKLFSQLWHLIDIIKLLFRLIIKLSLFLCLKVFIKDLITIKIIKLILF